MSNYIISDFGEIQNDEVLLPYLINLKTIIRKYKYFLIQIPQKHQKDRQTDIYIYIQREKENKRETDRESKDRSVI